VKSGLLEPALLLSFCHGRVKGIIVVLEMVKFKIDCVLGNHSDSFYA